MQKDCENIYNNIDDMRNRLDESYGKISVLLDVIMNQIWNLEQLKKNMKKGSWNY